MSARDLVNLIFYVFYGAIIARSILSFVIPMMGRPHPLLASVSRVVYQITEPILAPIRRVLPTFGMFDFSPMVAIILLYIIQLVLVSRL